MVFEYIDSLKREYTDRHVTVDTSRPELRRFEGQVGQVKTINMSGRALVQFGVRGDIGWYDIDIEFLRIVEQREEATEGQTTEAAGAAPAERSAPGPEAPAKHMSVAEILAAARGADTKKSGAKSEGKTSQMSVAEVLAAARGERGTGDGGKKETSGRAPDREDPGSKKDAQD